MLINENKGGKDLKFGYKYSILNVALLENRKAPRKNLLVAVMIQLLVDMYINYLSLDIRCTSGVRQNFFTERVSVEQSATNCQFHISVFVSTNDM